MQSSLRLGDKKGLLELGDETTLPEPGDPKGEHIRIRLRVSTLNHLFQISSGTGQRKTRKCGK